MWRPITSNRVLFAPRIQSLIRCMSGNEQNVRKFDIPLPGVESKQEIVESKQEISPSPQHQKQEHVQQAPQQKKQEIDIPKIRPFFLKADDKKSTGELQKELLKLAVPIDDCFDHKALLERLHLVKEEEKKKGIDSRCIEHHWQSTWNNPTNWTVETHSLLDKHGLYHHYIDEIVASTYGLWPGHPNPQSWKKLTSVKYSKIRRRARR